MTTGPENAKRETRYNLTNGAAALRMSMGRPAKVYLRNLSRSGFQTEWPYLLTKGERVWLTVKGIQALPADVVWSDGFTIGCRFEEALHPAVLARIVEQAGGMAVD